MVFFSSLHFLHNSYTLLILLLFVDVVFSVRVGMISNATFITSSISENFGNMTCTRCTCAALIAGVVGWNCVASNGTCQLISNYSSNDGYLVGTINGSFFFQKLPPELLRTASDTTISTKTAETTEITTKIATTTSNCNSHKTSISRYESL